MKTLLVHPRLCAFAALALLPSAALAQLSWTQVRTGAAPAPRFSHAAAFSYPAFETVMFGGSDGVQCFGDTWSWDGAQWVLRATVGPAPRDEHSLRRYDFRDDRLLLFGGRDPLGNDLGDTWIWNGQSWGQIATAVAPSARHGHAMAVDEFAERTLFLFGGRTQAGCSDETWKFVEGVWSQITTAHRPPAREDHVWIQDRLTMEFVLHGGRDEAGNVLADQWAFDGVDWRLVDGHTRPMASHAVEYQEFTRGRVLIVGEGAADATLEWDAQVQFLVHAALITPPARSESTVFEEWVFNGADTRGGLIFGGRSPTGQALGDTWRLSSATAPTMVEFGTGCGPSPWGVTGGPLLFAGTAPRLGNTVDLNLLTPVDASQALVVLGRREIPLPAGTCGLALRPERRLAMELSSLFPGLSSGVVTLPIPFDPALNGEQWLVQAFVRNPANPTQLDNSRPLRLTLAE